MATRRSSLATARHRGRSRWRRPTRTAVALAAVIAILTVPELAEASITEVNQQRAAAGLPPVVEDGGLTSLATQHSAQMAASGGLRHSGDLGGAVGSVAPTFTAAAENVGYGQSVATVTSMFMTSSAHRSAILGNFNAAGVGVVVGQDGRVWVTQVFARVAAGAASSGAVVGARSSRRSVRSRRRCRVIRGRRRCQLVRSRGVRRVNRYRHRHRR